jgi:cbb3-type cytochrome oxidase subunit 3
VTPSEIAAWGGVAFAMILAAVAWWLLGRAEQAELRRKKEAGSRRT